MSCEDCAAGRAVPQYRVFSLGCIYCGARYFAQLKDWPSRRQMPDGSTETTRQRQEWRAKVRNDWVAWGHDLDEFMRLAGEKKPPFEPVNARKA